MKRTADRNEPEPIWDVSDDDFEMWAKAHPYRPDGPRVYYMPRWLDEARRDSGRFHWSDLAAACLHPVVIGLVVVWIVSVLLALWL